MSARFKRQASTGAISVWLIALLVALVATIQIRSQAEVEKSFAGTDTTSLAFLIDNLHRANDSLQTETANLTQQQAMLQSGGDTAASQALTDESTRLRAVEGLIPVHGPGVVLVVSATGLTALDLEDALNNLGIGGAEAIEVNDRRFAVGVSIDQTQGGVTVGGFLVPVPWTISVIGDANQLAQAADLMTQSLRADRRVQQATYGVEADVVIRAVVTDRPFVYGTTP
ncbi:MAG TPA: DUF881 domain-containing protein [Candidatus Acidoferrum sp.]|jgi:uncharacterized protein YlxW (UPF0749 family)|nr:DUF881 domain-containing protein [Candidatus Acidoferrum sp.]